MVSSVHSLSDNLVNTAIISGWRIDAILISGIIWMLMSGYMQLRTALA